MGSRSSKVISLSLAQGITTLMSVLSGMVFARYLSLSDYATYLQTFLAYDFCVPILTLGLPSALYYFLPHENGDAKGLVIDNLTLLFLAGLIFSLFLIFGGTKIISDRFSNIELQNTLKWMIGYPLYTFPIVLSAVLIVRDKVRLNALYNVVTGLFLTLSIIVTSILTNDCMSPILVRVFLPLLFFPISLILTFKYLSGSFRLPKRSSMWKILKFSVPLGLATALGTLTLQMSNIVVSLLCSSEEYAIYAIGAKELPVVGIITGSIAVVTMAEMSQLCKSGNQNHALKIFKDSIVASSLFMIPIMCFLIFYAKDFITILYTSKYVGSIIPFTIYLLYLPVRCVFFGSAFVALGRSKLVMYRGILELLLTIIFSFLFVFFWGVYGAALASIVTVYFFSIPYNLFTLSREFNCSFKDIIPFKKIGCIFLLSFFSVLIPLSLYSFFSDQLLRFLISAIIYVFLYLLCCYKFIPNFSSLANNIVNRVVRRKHSN